MIGRWLALAATAAVVSAIAAALMIVGSPWTARLQRLDERRLADLHALAGHIEEYRSLQGRLPEHLAALENAVPGDVHVSDPATGEAYLYEVLDAERYRVCTGLALQDGSAAGLDPWPRPLRPEMALVPVTGPADRFCLETVRRPLSASSNSAGFILLFPTGVIEIAFGRGGST